LSPALGRAQANLALETIDASSPFDFPDAVTSAPLPSAPSPPPSADSAVRRGDELRELGNAPAAVAAYREALASEPDLARVRYELARLLIAAGQSVDAERELVAALDSVPTYSDAALELATLWRSQGRRTEALAVLVDLLERDASLAAALIVLIELL